VAEGLDARPMKKDKQVLLNVANEADGPALQVETVPIDSISADPANVRRHPARNLDAIKASLRRFGQQRPILVDGSGIVRAGNGTLEAAKALGWREIAIVQTGLTGSEATAYAIADNRMAELAEWDEVALSETLRALQLEDFPVEAAGFTDDEVDQLLGQLGDGALPADVEGKEYDESIADEVEYCECPACGHRWPR
jgi:ParB family transcriptional regulator, chromosome partitioning protein